MTGKKKHKTKTAKLTPDHSPAPDADLSAKSSAIDFHASSESDLLQLKERAKLLAKPLKEDEESIETLQLLIFPMADESYAVATTSVREVRPLADGMWAPVPCTPAFIVGVINVRGQLYSIMDIGEFLGLPSRPFPATPHVVLVDGPGANGDNMELCILSDGDCRVKTVLMADIDQGSTTISERIQEYVIGVTREMLVILDITRILADPEIIVNDSD